MSNSFNQYYSYLVALNTYFINIPLHLPNGSCFQLLDVFGYETDAFLVFEFCPYDVLTLIQSNKEKGLAPGVIKSCMRMLLGGVAACHENNILHRVSLISMSLSFFPPLQHHYNTVFRNSYFILLLYMINEGSEAKQRAD